MVNPVIKIITKLLIKLCIWRNTVYYIKGGNNDDVFLVRYIVYKSKNFRFYIHRFLRSDADQPHDHPASFYTYVVDGSYQEYKYDLNKPIVTDGEFKTYWSFDINLRKAGSLAFRKATDIHRVVLPRTYSLSEIEQAPLTICLMLKRERNWGYWKNGCYFIDWREYLNIKPNDSRIEGSE